MSRARRPDCTLAPYEVARRLRTPRWADLAAIREVYARSHAAAELLGGRFEVDHIIPLNGRTVSGLHVAENLRIVPILHNRKKANRVD